MTVEAGAASRHHADATGRQKRKARIQRREQTSKAVETGRNRHGDAGGDLSPAWTEVGSASESILLRRKACVCPQASA